MIATAAATAVVVIGILIWVLIAIRLARARTRLTRLSRAKTSAAKQPAAPAVGKAVLAPPVEVAPFPAEPTRFVGRAETIATASTALAPASGCTTVVFHGVAGAGKTTCAVELAYRRRRGFGALAFWSAPTDPDQLGDSLRLLAETLEAHLAHYGLAMVEETATRERLESFLPTLTAVFADADLLLVLDNLDALLTPDGQWRDRRWVPLIGALTDHQGPSRLILTSRVVPSGLNPDSVLISSVHALSWEESLWLIRRLPNLRALLHTVALGRCLLTLTQGHPQLLKLADAAAVDPARLAYQLAEIETAVDGSRLAAFLHEGITSLDAEQLRRVCTAWITTVAATTPAPSRLLLQVLCQIEEADRNPAIIGANWVALWQYLGQSGAPPPLATPVAALVNAALITTVPTGDPDRLVHYRIHPGVVEVVRAVTPEPVAAAVDVQFAAWWSAVLDGWAIEPPGGEEDTHQFTVRASLAAARYLLRRHDWQTASCLLERALIRNGYSPATSLALTPVLRRIAEATGEVKDLVVLGAALRKVDPGEAETLLSRAYHQAAADGNHHLASTTAGELVTLLRDQGRLRDALTLVEQKIEHTSQAGFGFWTQVSDQGRRLQILHLLGDHEQVLLDLPALRARIAELPDHRADNDRVNPWNAREGVLDIGRLSAVALERWDEALELNKEIVDTRQRRGASPQQIASSRFNDYVPLLRCDRLAEVDQLLRHCEVVFDAAGDTSQLAVIYGARANLESKRDHPVGAVELQRTSLRLRYLHPDPREVATAHHNLAHYLSRADGNPAEQRAHHLAGLLINHLTGNTRELNRTLAALTSELVGETSGPGGPVLPSSLCEVISLVDADDRIQLGKLLIALCPEHATAEQALADLVATAVNAADRSPDKR